MKKLLLTLAAAALTISASAAQFNQVWSKSVQGAFAAADAASLYKAAVAVDADGNVIATGAYTQDFAIGTNNFEAIGQSAYVIKYDKAGEIKWAVSIEGAATIVDAATDAEGNIFIAGQLTDEVEFGTTSGSTITKTGMEIWGAPTQKLNAAFIAKYNAAGAVQAVTTFVPEYDEDAYNTELLGDEAFYFSEDGDVAFHITGINVASDKVFAAATYSGTTKVGGATFKAGLANLFGMMVMDNTKAAVFAIDAAELASCKILAECGTTEPSGAMLFDTMSTVWSAAVAVDGSDVYAGFVGSGSLAVNNETIDATNTESMAPAFIIAKLNGDVVLGTKSFNGFISSRAEDNSIADMFVNDGKAYAFGSIYVEEEDGDETISAKWVIGLEADFNANDDIANYTAWPNEKGDVVFNRISAATLIDGTVYVNGLGYYTANASDDSYKNGDFAGTYNTLAFDITNFSSEEAWAESPIQAVDFAVNGANMACSAIDPTGATFSAYSSNAGGDTPTGIEDVINDNAAAEYFNLQGIRVANPENGTFIVRRGNKVSKELVR